MFDELLDGIIPLVLLVLEPLRHYRRFATIHRRVELSALQRRDLVRWRGERAVADGVRLGEGCRLFSYHVVGEPSLLELGNGVIVSGQVTFMTEDGAVRHAAAIPRLVGQYGRIRVGDNCFIGMGAIILPNVRIGRDCIIAAGSVVRRDVPDGCVVMGNPARAILSMAMYRKMKLGSPWTIRSAAYGYPHGDLDAPEATRRGLIEAATRDARAHAPRPAAARDVRVEPGMAAAQ